MLRALRSNNTSDTQYRPLRREHADAARAGQSLNGLPANKSPLKEKRTIRPMARIVRFSLFSLRGLFDAARRELYGIALTPGGRCLRALRMNGITSNKGHTKVVRNTAVRGNVYFLGLAIN